ncbi:thiamine phosphate synthase [Rhodoferax saidenbachensis]|uniref:Thiamine-phosphate synthase n=1 Tax=Rhodoferax saidenbachensis TaxID=1484693 RepID=A0A1P8K9F7_9BURK|nr:thiamine phosphate synthase [Rhodoferax saidenbachensis]APW42630.1 thiamine phosphate synthase [Rhodoferax saidenbachensis]
MTHSALASALRLYLVTDQVSLLGHTLTDVMMAAVQGGVTCVQLREKQLTTRDFVAQAMALSALLRPLHIPLVINDRIDVALACNAQGVHLGQSDMPVELARSLLPPEVFIGWSVETMDDVTRSASLPVDYLGVSPVFATPTKTDTHTPWGLDGLRRVRAITALPLVAIGGIHSGNALDVLRAGADGLAMVSAICSAPDPRLAAQTLRTLCDGI